MHILFHQHVGLTYLGVQSPGLVSSSVPEYATPSVPHHNTQKVKDMPLYSDVFETQKVSNMCLLKVSERSTL